MKTRFKNSGGGYRHPASLGAALVLVALVPAVCVLWFMNAAMRNERLAAQQRLAEVYANQLAALQRSAAGFAAERRALLARGAELPPALRFAQLVRANFADSAIVYDRDGHVAYPADSTNALPALNAELRKLRAMRPTDAAWPPALENLEREVNDYSFAELSSPQRRFLMAEIRQLAPGVSFTTDAAEQLAADASEGGVVATRAVWRLTNVDGTVAALDREARLREDLLKALEPLALPDIGIALLAPGQVVSAPQALAPQPLGPAFPGWRIALTFRGADPLATAAARQTRIYLWIGGLVVAIIALLAVLVARYVAAQMRLARIKDELVSTVSHELKTPLASMRALVDTLLAGRYRDETQVHEYLLLMARENARLSHLMENFLSFSRMESGRHQFQFEPVAPEVVVGHAVGALREKLTAANCAFEARIAPGLPRIHADADALVTVLINLLDNAYKYTNGEKRISARAFAESDQMCFEVEDNGIGLPPTESKRIFDRFYQVDQSLTRQRGGCGLGLSIVQFIVRAHRGAVEVRSAPGRGSVFRVTIPLAAEAALGP